MKILAKIVFASVLLVLNSVCFADALEEELELNSDILVPIICHFNDSSSLTKCVSTKLIDQQKKDKMLLNRFEVLSIYSNVAASLKDYGVKLDAIREASACPKGDKNQLTASGLANSLKLAWELKVSNCGEYSLLVMIIFEFNRMNNYLLGKPLNFKEAMFVTTKGKTGDHVFVLIEGLSGTMFAVDPWIWKVTKLEPSFMKLPDIHKGNHSLDTIDIPAQLNQKINQLYGSNSKASTYYDMIYLQANTKWNLDITRSKKIYDLIHEQNKEMKELYDTLRFSDRLRFPQWVMEYDELFPDHQTGHSKADVEEKKPEPDQKTSHKNQPEQ